MPPRTRVDGLIAAAGLAALQGEHARTGALVDEALAVARTEGYGFGVVRAQHILAVSAEWQGLLDEAATRYEALLARAEEFGAAHWKARILSQLAEVVHMRGDVARAEVLAEEGLALGRQVGHAWDATLCLGVLANLASDRGDAMRAATLYAANLERSRELGDLRGIAGALGGFAGIALGRGQAERAARLLGAARALGDAIGVAHLGHALYFERVVAATRARLGETAFAPAWVEGHATTLTLALSEAMAIAAEATDRSAAPVPAQISFAADAGLTVREVEVLRLLVRRLTDKEIAGALSISSRTAMTHVSTILGKLGVTSRRAAADWAIHHGLD
jgi:non-specific serine/threonine protein kinase